VTDTFTENERQSLRSKARDILALNDRGRYTIPTHGLYPFQWNWDSCLTALGLQFFDDDRAWLEIETLVAHQWPDGMVPHIIFHERDEGYFPGPQVWDTQRPVPTSGITQPPVLGMVIEQLWERGRRDAATRARCVALLEAADRWHRWFHRWRDPDGTGLVCLLHPWEAGRDNSCDFDTALAAVPVSDLQPYRRRDTQHVDPSQRPTAFEYDRYVTLVQRFKACDWQAGAVYAASPFKVVDPGFNAILVRSERALALLGREFGLHALAEAAQARSERGAQALEALWNDALGQYDCLDRMTGQLVDSASVGGLLPLLALSANHPRWTALTQRIGRMLDAAPFGVCSHAPEDPRFDPRRYWRGPSWLIINYLLVKGLREASEQALAERIRQASLACIARSGFSEYYQPITGQALGGGTFTWTAAMVVEFLREH
jgi:glycogen debranching enzyme